MRLISEEEVRRALDPFHEQLSCCVYGAWGSYLAIVPSLPAPPNLRLRANLVYHLIHHQAATRFTDYPGVEYLELAQNFMLRVGGRFVLRFKKVNEQMRSSAIPTVQALAFESQIELPGMPQGAFLKVGYLLSPLGTEIDEAMIIHPMGSDAVAWAYELPRPDSGLLLDLPTSPVLPVEGESLARIRKGLLRVVKVEEKE